MTRMSAVVLTAEQVGVDRDGSVAKTQIKDFIWQKNLSRPMRSRPL